jgi:hypothetical protein
MILALEAELTDFREIAKNGYIVAIHETFIKTKLISVKG